MLVIGIAVEFSAVNSVGVAIVRGVALFKFQLFFAFDFVVDTHDGFAARCE
jgi:hypothetical protein